MLNAITQIHNQPKPKKPFIIRFCSKKSSMRYHIKYFPFFIYVMLDTAMRVAELLSE